MTQSRTIYFLGGNFKIVDGTASTNLTVELAKGFESHGCQATIIPLNQQRKTTGEPNPRYRGVTCQYANLGLLDRIPLPGVSWLRGMVVLARLSVKFMRRKNRPDFVFCMTMWWWAAAILAMVCRCTGITIIFYLVEEPFALAKMNYENNDINAILFGLKKFQAYLLYKILACMNFVCCITRALCNQVINRGVNADRVSLLPNVRFLSRPDQGEAANEQKLQSTDDDRTQPVRVLYTGRVNYTRDDFSTLLDAAGQVMNEQLGLEIHIYGSGPKKDVQLIQSRIEDEGLSDIVHWHGFVSRKELEAAQRQAIAFLLLKADIAQNRYNFPTKLMDYLSASRPVILTNIENHRIYFEDRVNCLFVTPGDANGLAAVFRSVFQGDSGIEEIGRQGSLVLHEFFNAETEAGKLLERVAGNSQSKRVSS